MYPIPHSRCHVVNNSVCDFFSSLICAEISKFLASRCIVTVRIPLRHTCAYPKLKSTRNAFYLRSTDVIISCLIYSSINLILLMIYNYTINLVCAVCLEISLRYERTTETSKWNYQTYGKNTTCEIVTCRILVIRLFGLLAYDDRSNPYLAGTQVYM